MKDNGQIKCIGVLTGLLCLCSGLAAAVEPPTLITIDQVVEVVTKQGFNQISEIELSDDHNKYEVKALDSQRRRVEIELDARSGVIIEIDRDD